LLCCEHKQAEWLPSSACHVKSLHGTNKDRKAQAVQPPTTSSRYSTGFPASSQALSSMRSFKIASLIPSACSPPSSASAGALVGLVHTLAKSAFLYALLSLANLRPLPRPLPEVPCSRWRPGVLLLLLVVAGRDLAETWLLQAEDVQTL
jgi:hypothetical protein